jgi:uncharacterized membrane protein
MIGISEKKLSHGCRGVPFGQAAAASRISQGVALAVYAVCVWPANFKHAFGGIDVPHLSSRWWCHAPRLALQPVIVWWALFCAGVINWPLSRLLRRRSP